MLSLVFKSSAFMRQHYFLTVTQKLACTGPDSKHNTVKTQKLPLRDKQFIKCRHCHFSQQISRYLNIIHFTI